MKNEQEESVLNSAYGKVWDSLAIIRLLRSRPLEPNTDLGFGQEFIFATEDGGRTIAGTIMGMENTPDGLLLYVSVPRFRGRKLIGLIRSNGKWGAYVDEDPFDMDTANLAMAVARGEMSSEQADNLIKAVIASRFEGGYLRLLK